jgi:aspartyl protease family protein
MFQRFVFGTVAFGVAIGLAAPSHRGVARPAQVREIDTSYGTKAIVLNRADNGHFYADGQVNGHGVHFLVDTGATDVVLTRADAQAIGLDFSPDRFTVIGRGASGDVHGEEVELGSIQIGNKEVDGIRAVIVADGLDVSLLGQSFLERVSSVNIAGDEMTID